MPDPASPLSFPVPLPKGGQSRAWWRAPSSGTALAAAIAAAAQRHAGPLLVVARDNHAAHQLEADLRLLAAGNDGLPVLGFPDWETLPYDRFSPHPDIVSQRLATLARLPGLQRGIVVVPVATLMQRLAPLGHVLGNRFDLRSGQRLDLDAEKRRLESAGYRNVPQVQDPGDFAVRGGLLDVYPMGSDAPFRLELLDDEIDTIRVFDPESQRSLERIDGIELLPGREVPLDDAHVQRALDALRERFDIDTRRSPLVQDLKAGVAPAGIEYYLPLFFETPRGAESSTATLFDYLADGMLPLLCDGVGEAAEHAWQQIGQRYEQLRHDVERPLLPPPQVWLSPDALREVLNRGGRIEVCAPQHPRQADAQPLPVQPAPALPLAAKDHAPAQALRDFLGSYPGRVLVAADSAGRREALREVLEAAGLQPAALQGWQDFATHDARFALAVAAFDDGFALDNPALCVLTERQLFPERASQPRRRKRAGREPEAIIRDLGELSLGAPIVHEDHGVGRYRGLVAMDIGGMPGEFLDIEYAKGDRLYVPVAQLIASVAIPAPTPDTAPLHNLGGEQWAKAKKKAAEKVRDVAAELLEIQARRHARKGLAIDVDRAMYEPFAATFPFEETPDQHAAIEAVIRDSGVLATDGSRGLRRCRLRQDRSGGARRLRRRHQRQAGRGAGADHAAGRTALPQLPRPLCRLAAESRSAVALQEQEGDRRRTAEARRGQARRDRRHPSPAAAGREIQGPRPGHRRRGTTLRRAPEGSAEGAARERAPAHPHRHADPAHAQHGDEPGCATFRSSPRRRPTAWRCRPSSTPGTTRCCARPSSASSRAAARCISCTTTWRASAACTTRVARAGARGPHRHRPRADAGTRAGTGDAGFPQTALQRAAVHDHHRIRHRHPQRQHHRHPPRRQVRPGPAAPAARPRRPFAPPRLCLPHRADRKRSITSDAKKRLEAIASMDELGAGFTLATHDLEIRGAGELLGEGQSGQMAEIGFSLYTELLERAVRSRSSRASCPMSMATPATAPTSTCTSRADPRRLPARRARAPHPVQAHQRRPRQRSLARTAGGDDRPLRPAHRSHQALFATAELKLDATRLGIRKLDLGATGGRLQFVEKPNVDPMSVIRLIQGQPKHYKMDGPDKLRITLDLPDAVTRFNAARGMLTALAPG
jgi:transcription-repair coupling factor (superfamily II helicase)